jgi:DNA-directed RNA polymerase subunit RPC12/RpoP
VPRLYIGEALDVHALRSLLAQEGIEAVVLNQTPASASVDVASFATWPELWIANEEDEPAARAIVERYLADKAPRAEKRPAWKCPRCGEMIEVQFTDCWRCTVTTEDDPRLDPASRCAECGYRLYKLPLRRCPECGTEF